MIKNGSCAVTEQTHYLDPINMHEIPQANKTSYAMAESNQEAILANLL